MLRIALALSTAGFALGFAALFGHAVGARPARFSR
jgi:hypothetical protein